MLVTQHYHTDEIECSVEAKNWVPVKTLQLVKDPFNMNIIKVHIAADCIVAPEETKGYLGIFINNEEKPRTVIESDLPFSYIFRKEFDVWDLPAGQHKLIIKMKSENGFKVSNTYFEVKITRFYTIYEMVGTFTPLFILAGLT